MHSQGIILGHRSHRTLAIVGCLALLYFAAGGIFLHQHTGSETVCPVCHVLHLQALAAAPLDLIPRVQQVEQQLPLATSLAPTAPFALARASRAPPSA
jgi:hypothetical protein